MIDKVLELRNFIGRRGGFSLRVDYFRLAPGEIVFLYGRSGCGKTTFLDMLAGVISTQLTSECRSVFSDISYVMHYSTMLPWLTVEESLKIESRLRKRDCDINLFNLLCGRFGLRPGVHHKNSGHLSLGMRQRVEIAKSIAFGSKLILIDEGLSGLDAEVKKAVAEALLDAVEQGVAIVGVAHQISDLLSLAQRVYLLDKGCLGREITVELPPRERLLMPIEELVKLHEVRILLQNA